MKRIKEHKEFFFEKFEQDINDIHLEHGFEFGWNINQGELTGFHSTNLHPENVIYYTHGPNKHGVSRAVVGKFGKNKRSSLYPARWEVNTINDKIVEALLTGIKEKATDGSIKILGKAQNYIPEKNIVPFDITILLQPNGIIRSSWPKI